MVLREWLKLQWQLIRPYGRHIHYKLRPDLRPDYFQKPWTYPGSRLGTGNADLPVADRFACFFLPMNDWHARLQRSQQLAKSIAESGDQVIYVNPHLGLEYLRPYCFDPYTRIAKLAPGLFELHVHLAREHELNQRLLTAAEISRLSRELGRLIDVRGIRKAALVVSFPAWLEVANQLRHQYGFPIIYDCHDWLPGFRRVAPAFLGLEEDLFRLSDLVVFCSQRLQEKVLEQQPVGSKSMLIRNAVEPFAGTNPTPPDRSTRAKTIGYVGALDHWFDVHSVGAVASEHPDWRIVLAGRVEDLRVLQLRKYPNVTFVGEIPHAAVESLLCGWDVGMIPFLVNDLTLATNPIKLYEYFSVGLPVVSTRLPEVELYGDLVYLADSPRGFSSMTAAAMGEQDASLRRRRIDTARHETWQSRAELLLERIRPLAGAPVD
jgi:glycosyltransferase involved in cell wall biosynthesis